jgi:hypothetical protein
VLFAIALLASSVGTDLRKKMWVDELYTLHIAEQRTVQDIVNATLDGCDGAPPLYATLVHAFLPLFQDHAVAVRLPSTIGYVGMLLCLLAFCRRRLPDRFAWIVTLLACAASWVYSWEGRPYGLQLGCGAAALLCWQNAASGSRRMITVPLLAIFGCLMVALQYYSIFFLGALLIGELVRWRNSRRPDIAVLGAITCGFGVLALHYPFIQVLQNFQEHYWSPARWTMIPETYWNFYAVMLYLCVITLLIWGFGLRKASQELSNLATFADYEWVAVVAMCLLPAIVLTLSQFTTHVFVERYVLFSLPAGAIVLGTSIYRIVRGDRATAALMLSIVLFGNVLLQAKIWSISPRLVSGEDTLRALQAMPPDADSSEPIVIAHHHIFLELSYYAPKNIRERLIYPTSRSLDLRYLNTDTGYLLTSGLRKWSTLQIMTIDELLAGHQHFLLAAWPVDYLHTYLKSIGYRVVPIPRAGGPAILFEVSR